MAANLQFAIFSKRSYFVLYFIYESNRFDFTQIFIRIRILFRISESHSDKISEYI